MEKLPIYFGYAGAVPFIVFLIATITVDTDLYPAVPQFLSFLQIAYSCMILSFLGGVHWGQALPSNNTPQILFAMVPTIASLILMIWSLAVSPAQSLFVTAGMFWLVYAADHKLMPRAFIPDGYFKYRKNLTIIVSVTLLLSGLFLVLNPS